MTDAKRLRACRTKLRLSQKELANLLGTKRWISHWESGRFQPPPFVWLALEKLEVQRQRGRHKTRA